MPRDWALRPSYDTRVAIINAMYACGENVQKLMPVLFTEAIRRDRQASLLSLSLSLSLSVSLSLSLSLPSRAVSQHRLSRAA